MLDIVWRRSDGAREPAHRILDSAQPRLGQTTDGDGGMALDAVQSSSCSSTYGRTCCSLATMTIKACNLSFGSLVHGGALME
jgi:hypothetical protein